MLLNSPLNSVKSLAEINQPILSYDSRIQQIPCSLFNLKCKSIDYSNEVHEVKKKKRCVQ